MSSVRDLEIESTEPKVSEGAKKAQLTKAAMIATELPTGQNPNGVKSLRVEEEGFNDSDWSKK